MPISFHQSVIKTKKIIALLLQLKRGCLFFFNNSKELGNLFCLLCLVQLLGWCAQQDWSFLYCLGTLLHWDAHVNPSDAKFCEKFLLCSQILMFSNPYDFSLSLLKKAENVSVDLCSLGLWVWQCHHGFCRLHRLSLPFVMPEIYHEQFEQKMGTPTRHYHHYTDESIIKSGRPMSSALISQPFSLTLP